MGSAFLYDQVLQSAPTPDWVSRAFHSFPSQGSGSFYSALDMHQINFKVKDLVFSNGVIITPIGH
ncbi:hypothetical protein HNP46_000028 [Pseudomonas nitritireducens]|uniref:Uncharacterized protein n=1 Tax=Pseudomonas nitroreducens TaxID=46680 RepID=A0A7W7NZH2_PSENT|nr:hypothetical protein [Pseudomonas nitritireducens]